MVGSVLVLLVVTNYVSEFKQDRNMNILESTLSILFGPKGLQIVQVSNEASMWRGKMKDLGRILIWKLRAYCYNNIYFDLTESKTCKVFKCN